MPPAAAEALRFTTEGDRVRRATALLEGQSAALAAALRRAVPYLARRNVPVSLAYAAPTSLGGVLGELATPLSVTPFTVTPGGATGALVLDGGAVSAFLDGVLGGGKNPARLTGPRLSAPQATLIGRVAANILSLFSDALSVRLGISFRERAATPDDAAQESVPVACALAVGAEPDVGHVVLLVPREALSLGAGPKELPPPVNTQVAALLGDVPVELVAELGRARLPLSTVANLKVGELLRLDTSAQGSATVRSSGQVIFRGRPTSAGMVLGIRLDARPEK